MVGVRAPTPPPPERDSRNDNQNFARFEHKVFDLTSDNHSSLKHLEGEGPNPLGHVVAYRPEQRKSVFVGIGAEWNEQLEISIGDACGVSSPHSQTTPQAISGYFESIFTFTVRQLELKATIIAMTVAAVY